MSLFRKILYPFKLIKKHDYSYNFKDILIILLFFGALWAVPYYCVTTLFTDYNEPYRSAKLDDTNCNYLVKKDKLLQSTISFLDTNLTTIVGPSFKDSLVFRMFIGVKSKSHCDVIKLSNFSRSSGEDPFSVQTIDILNPAISFLNNVRRTIYGEIGDITVQIDFFKIYFDTQKGISYYDSLGNKRLKTSNNDVFDPMNSLTNSSNFKVIMSFFDCDDLYSNIQYDCTRVVKYSTFSIVIQVITFLNTVFNICGFIILLDKSDDNNKDISMNDISRS